MSKIQWTEETWNPIAGCTRVSPGCQNCYAEKMAKRLQAMGQPKYRGTIDKNGRWSGKLNRADGAGFNEPLRNKKPTIYFVNSMSDLFHESVLSQWLIGIWNIMRETPHHTYQILTKRADVMERRINWLVGYYGILPNVWLGVSVENQEYADKRIPYLLKTPAAVRFLSCEPLLGPVDLTQYIAHFGVEKVTSGTLLGEPATYTTKGWSNLGINWVIVGGESGPDARPFQLDWARSLVSQCKAAEVAVFVKQLGTLPVEDNYTYLTQDRKGGNPAEWPLDLQIREMPLWVTA